jgi:hypothetical protein
MFWFVVGVLIVLACALYTVSTRGGGRWTFLPFVNQGRSDLAQEEYLAEAELARRADEKKSRDLAP